MGGNQIYGGWIDWFVGKDGIVRYNFLKYLHFEGESDMLDIASDPLWVCLCIDKVPNCTIDEYQQMILWKSF